MTELILFICFDSILIRGEDMTPEVNSPQAVHIVTSVGDMTPGCMA